MPLKYPDDPVHSVMHEYKHGTLRSFGGYDKEGRKIKGAKISDRAQAIAIALSEASKSGQDACILGAHGKAGGHAGYGRS